jgi:hypothetical protein
VKEIWKAYWGLLLAAALIVPYALGVWEEYGYGAVVVTAVAFLLIIILSRQVKVVFWWEGLWKRKKKE